MCKELLCDLDKAHHQRALFDVIVSLENWFTCSGHDHKEYRNDESFVLAHRKHICQGNVGRASFCASPLA